MLKIGSEFIFVHLVVEPSIVKVSHREQQKMRIEQEGGHRFFGQLDAKPVRLCGVCTEHSEAPLSIFLSQAVQYFPPSP